MTDPKSEEAKVIKANRGLQTKVGTGQLDEDLLAKCQSVMDGNDVDFEPMAKEFLNLLGDAIKNAKEPGANTKKVIHSMTAPVMQLKANAALFKFNLVGSLANVMLSFLESVEELDKDAIAIVEAHHKTLSAIIIKNMKGDGGTFGKQMEEELRNACKRYYARAS